ncbi:MAG TPA: LLM class F420-dependent oxidoreductase [Terriglobia bacterium]|nr:LLM class F420-dependent oxidoreductase [Terriglobia bacterium]
MKFGLSIPHIGNLASPEAIRSVAERAEELGYDSLWVLERTLVPVNPIIPYPATKDGKLPDEYKIVLDPIESLTFAAAVTSRIRLGTSVIVLGNHFPLLLARRLATLDVLSRGRLICGLGIGWSQDEIEAAGVDFKTRGRRADEFVQVLKKIWTEDPVEFSGKFFQIPKSYIGPKPVQKPHPPIIFGGFVGKSFERVVKHGSGWNPSGVPAEHLQGMIESMRAAARAEGKRPEDFEVYYRAFWHPTREEFKKLEDIGVNHVILDLNFNSYALDAVLKQMGEIKP